MKDQLVALAGQAAHILLPFIAAMTIALIAKAIAWLSAKTKNETIIHLLQQLQAAATTAVNAAEQSLAQAQVPPAELKAKAVTSVRMQLGQHGLDQLKKTLKIDDVAVSKIIDDHVEAKVLENKIYDNKVEKYQASAGGAQ